MRLRLPVFVLLVVLGGWLAAPVSAQLPKFSSPSDVQLVAQTRGGQKTFRIGEVIPIDLSFTSSSSEAYAFNTATYDRSGRLNRESFAIEPKNGWDDPLDAYFHSYQGFIGGGLRGSELLSARPTVIGLELNQWVRFLTPGHYRLRITSSRVSRMRAPESVQGLSVASNELLLTIIPPSKDWQARTLESAVATLDQPQSRGSPTRENASLRQQAEKVLRYLGTPDAARELARRITGTERDWEFKFGLVGSPAKEAGLEEMKRLLVDPNFPVTDQFLATMSVIAVSDDAGEKRPEEREQAEAGFGDELVLAIAGKRGAARAVSADTIVEHAAIYSHPLPPDVKTALTRELVADFDRLPIDKQAELLQYRWSALDPDEMLPLLKKVAGRYRDFHFLREMNAFQFNNASAAALKHWYELAPEEARPAIIQEMLRPKPRFGADVLGMLPDKELPEVESALAEHLAGDDRFDVNGKIASLIERYATAGVEAPVTTYLDPMLGKMACEVQTPLLAYLLKVDPAAARPRIESALAARGQGFSACNHQLLPELARLHNDPLLQEAAIKSLEDPDPEVVQGAASYLRSYGSASAEDVLWARLTAWSALWKGRESEFAYVPNGPMEGIHQTGLGQNLLQALATGHGWLADETKLRRLVDLSVGDEQRRQAFAWMESWRKKPREVVFVDENTFQVAQYQEDSMERLKEKLSQFPRGSSFVWVDAMQDVRRQEVFQEIGQFASEKGFRMTFETQ